MADNENRSFQDNDPNHGKDTPAYKADPGQPVLGDDTGELSADGASERITEDEVQEAFRDQSGAGQDGAQPGGG
ncbi:hypothetical protein [Phenylobacterium deserti]|uniref:Uncharacterized protein n=1 Tax=Phenylobacterium deserti TaxID=1914756 RepID=A0A328AFD3_9CAUL|nr:hypothetical protein [Phenylobacterium deserti]RAK51508.1 hypothetical protein DJ018_16385 [Phenylobacterium deserti]